MGSTDPTQPSRDFVEFALLLLFVAVHLCWACLPPGNDLDLEVEWVHRNKNFPTPEPSFCRLVVRIQHPSASAILNSPV